MAHSVTGSRSGGSQDDARQPLTRFHWLELEGQLGTSVWLARADGDRVAARIATAAVFDPASPSRETTLERAAALASLRSAHLVPLLGLAERADATWLVSEYVEGVPLSRLLVAAILTPVQAVYIAVRLFQGLAVMHESGVAHGRLTAANVLVSVDGEPRITDWSLESLVQAHGFDDASAEDLTAARGLVAEMGRNADRPVVRHRGRYDALMAELERTGSAADAEAARTSSGRLEHALLAAVGDATSMASTRAEIGALVTMLTRRSAPNGRPNVHTSPVPVAVPQMLASGRLSHADWHHGRPRRSTRRGVAVLAVAAVLAGGYLFGREPAGNLVDRLAHRDRSPAISQPAQRPGTTRSATGRKPGGTAKPARPTPRPVPVLAPSRAGALTAVTIRPLTSCAAGGTCLLRATARITPAGQPRQVRLQVSVVNRCTGALRTVLAGSVTAQPGWTSVFVSASVALPRARSLAAVAVATAPARAASPPLLVPATGGSC